MSVDREYEHPYRIRGRNLKALGFENYNAYLKSALWKRIRRAVIKDKKCVGCRRKATCVHHASYDMATMRGECTATLLPSCKYCHRRAERAGKGWPADERLAHVTFTLLAGRRAKKKKQGPRRVSQVNMAHPLTWRAARAVPIKCHHPDKITLATPPRTMSALRGPFDATPRLRKPAEREDTRL